MKREELSDIIQKQNLSIDKQFTVHGPWGYVAMDGLEAPIYISIPGETERRKVGKVIVRIDGGMKFEVQLDEKYRHLRRASFEVPMRFLISRNSEVRITNLEEKKAKAIELHDQGLSNAEIAQALGITENQVRTIARKRN